MTLQREGLIPYKHMGYLTKLGSSGKASVRWDVKCAGLKGSSKSRLPFPKAPTPTILKQDGGQEPAGASKTIEKVPL